MISTDQIHTQKGGAPGTGEGPATSPPDIESCLIQLYHQEEEKSCWTFLGPDFGFASRRETVGKVFELSFSSLNWDDKIDLTFVRIELGT